MKALFFDLDYTIVHYDYESLDDKMMLEWLRSEGVNEPEKIYFSNEWNNLEKRMKYFRTDINTYKLEWRPRFQTIEMEHKRRLYNNGKIWINDGAKEFINDVKVPKALISNSASSVVDWLLDKFQLSNSFDYIYRRPYDYEDIRKPDSRVATKVMEAMFLDSQSKIGMIGDSITDMVFAKNAGLISISLFHKLNGCDMYFETFEEMSRHLKKLYPSSFRIRNKPYENEK